MRPALSVARDKATRHLAAAESEIAAGNYSDAQKSLDSVEEALRELAKGRGPK